MDKDDYRLTTFQKQHEHKSKRMHTSGFLFGGTVGKAFLGTNKPFREPGLTESVLRTLLSEMSFEPPYSDTLTSVLLTRARTGFLHFLLSLSLLYSETHRVFERRDHCGAKVIVKQERQPAHWPQVDKDNREMSFLDLHWTGQLP